MENKNSTELVRKKLPQDASQSNMNASVAETSSFRLFDLPPELWVRIGKMVINDLPALTLGRINFRSERIASFRVGMSTEWGLISSELRPPAILQTCSALRNELRNGYYQSKICIMLPLWLSSERVFRLGQYLRMIGPEARRQVQTRNVRCSGQGSEGLYDMTWWETVSNASWDFEMMVTQKRLPDQRMPGAVRAHFDWHIKFL
ncbi:unnamed protein product [Zymoseptoria tritici ST99CH_1A5]|uniref:F-box domain-containing protein n=1 Tax=Zymoseptoria tritici ST99CH_1A5 TaxID=1276529 RepID=A0A1Y6LI54_ZYMTR|nr:unnamed protein product [Zymoseptoria tritici ST99CH_3D1]SMY24036.1 unnamed protein product [Zymoseptoria tritici ST99CH_1A5]